MTTIQSFHPGDPIPDFDAGLLISQQANEHLRLEDGGARCSLWWDCVPEMAGEKPGIIGHFEAASAEAGAVLLAHAAVRLQTQGCTVAVGPMDGNTWRRYRVLTERGSEPPFFMEPDNPDYWAEAFAQAGFGALSSYTSSLVADLTRRDSRMTRVSERLERDGIRIRNLDPARFEEDLRRIFRVSVVSFTKNFLYTELSEAGFLAQYLPYRDKIRPELVFLAEDAEEPVGYMFAIPDYAEALRGEPIRTVVGKTLAILPGRRYAGLGLLLVGLLHERAHELGYGRVIHALQNEDNQVRNLSDYFGDVMRRYALYVRTLR